MRTDATTKLLLAVIAAALTVIAVNLTVRPIIAQAKTEDAVDKIADTLDRIRKDGMKIEVSQKWGDVWRTQETR